jgi:hypothetical protein
MRRGGLLWDGLAWLTTVVAVSGLPARGEPAGTTRPTPRAATAPATRPAATATEADPDLIGSWQSSRAIATEVPDGGRRGRAARPTIEGGKVILEDVGGRRGLRLVPVAGGLTAGDDAAFDFTADFTVALRVRLASDQGAIYLLSKRSADNDDGWAVVHGLADGGVGFVAAPRVAVPTPVKAFDRWVHVAVTFRRRDLLLYVDGKAIGVTELPNVPLASKAPLILGAGVGGRKGMDGWLDDVRVYHRALTEGEVEALSDGREPPSPYLRLSEAEQARVRGLVKALGDDAYAKREAAAGQLRGMGRKIYPLLREYRDSEDFEVASRIRALLGELPRGEQ